MGNAKSGASTPTALIPHGSNYARTTSATTPKTMLQGPIPLIDVPKDAGTLQTTQKRSKRRRNALNDAGTPTMTEERPELHKTPLMAHNRHTWVTKTRAKHQRPEMRADALDNAGAPRTAHQLRTTSRMRYGRPGAGQWQVKWLSRGASPHSFSTSLFSMARARH
jgi:hypothetical protein